MIYFVLPGRKPVGNLVAERGYEIPHLFFVRQGPVSYSMGLAGLLKILRAR